MRTLVGLGDLKGVLEKMMEMSQKKESIEKGGIMMNKWTSK